MVNLLWFSQRTPVNLGNDDGILGDYGDGTEERIVVALLGGSKSIAVNIFVATTVPAGIVVYGVAYVLELVLDGV